MSPDRSHRCIPAGRSLALTATLAAVGAGGPEEPIGLQATTSVINASALSNPRMRPTLRDGLQPSISLEEDGPAARKELMQRVLDPLPHLFTQLQHELWVGGGARSEVRDVDRLAEGDEPLRRQRQQTDQAQPGKSRGDRDRGQTEQPGDRARVEDHRVHLFRADHRHWDDRRAGPERNLDETAAAQPLHAIAVAVSLRSAFDALWEHAH